MKANEGLTVSRVSLSTNDQNVLDIHLDEEGGKIEDITSDMLNTGRFKNYYTSLRSVIDSQAPIFSIFSGDRFSQKHQIARSVAGIFSDALQALSLCFVSPKLSHVSPIRAYPRRFYLADQSHDAQGEGSNLIEILRDNEPLKNRANQWLRKFGIEIDVERMREVLHRLAIHQDDNSVDLDITDVGFGVSQVLPVLVDAFLNPANGLSLVEQPEIHLHPKMQAELTDFFLDIVLAMREKNTTRANCSFMIETHSISLLRRLRTRLVADEGEFIRQNVAIYNVGRTQNGPSVPVLAPISDDGKFPWPLDFLEAELEETMGYLTALGPKRV